MNYSKKTVRDMDVAGKKVLLRCDFNVPQDKVTGEITSDKRIVAALPTIRYLLEQGAAVIACSHLGKPKDGPDPKLSLAPVAKRLSELLGQEVLFAHDVVGEDAKAKAAALRPGQTRVVGDDHPDGGRCEQTHYTVMPRHAPVVQHGQDSGGQDPAGAGCRRGYNASHRGIQL